LRLSTSFYGAGRLPYPHHAFWVKHGECRVAVGYGCVCAVCIVCVCNSVESSRTVHKGKQLTLSFSVVATATLEWVGFMESDLVEIYLDKETHELYYYIPASGQIFVLELGEELNELPKNAKKLLEINFTEKKAFAEGITEIPLF